MKENQMPEQAEAAVAVDREVNDQERAEIAEREERASRGLKLRLSDLQRVIDQLEAERNNLIHIGEKFVASGEKDEVQLTALVEQYNIVVGKLLFCAGVKTKILSENLDESRDVNLARADM
jgi:hypothetical protein